MASLDVHDRAPLPGDVLLTLYDNKPDDPRELAFDAHTLVTVLDKEDKAFPGWIRCAVGGQSGLVPLNFCSLQSPVTDAPSKYQNVLSYENLPVSQDVRQGEKSLALLHMPERY